MHIAILALGSRGDVQPFVALGRGLLAAGHTVTLAAPEDYAALVAGAGIPFAGLGGLIRAQMDMPRVAAMLDGAGNPLSFALDTLPQVLPLVERLVADGWAAAAGADALLVSTLGLYPGLSLAEKLDIPLLVAHFHPLGQTSAGQHPNFPPLPRGLPGRSVYNRMTHSLGQHGLWQLLRRPLNRARRRVLGLPPLGPAALIRRVQVAQRRTVYGYSRHVAPLPPHLPTTAAVTGFWLLDHPPAFTPDPRLAAFLAAGPPPLYVGFGSNLTGLHPDRLTQLFVGALERNGQRGLLYCGWGDFGNGPLPATVLRIDSAPHDWLFPRTAGVVHHGGAGSTAAALAAGIPAVAMPFLGDQFFWARRVHDLGCGPAPLDRHTLTVEHLAASLTDLAGAPHYRQRAQAVSLALAAEPGVANAVAWIERATGWQAEA